MTAQPAEALHAHFNKEYEAGKEFKPNKANWLEGKWTGFTKAASGLGKEPDTGVDVGLLKSIGNALAVVPDGFNLNRKIDRQLKAKIEMMRHKPNPDELKKDYDAEMKRFRDVKSKAAATGGETAERLIADRKRQL